MKLSEKYLKALYYGLLFICMLMLLYVLLAFVLGIIPVNKDFSNADEGVEIYVVTNRVHTDLVLPVANEYIDWRDHIPLADFDGVDASFRYITIGWGDKGFYINTPQWSDLTPKIAFTALFVPSPTAMHITYLRYQPFDASRSVPLRLTAAQYEQLISFILPYFQTAEEGGFILIPGAGYGKNDNFYEARQAYHLFNTSNNWTNKALQNAGARAAVWSPFDMPIMYQVRQVE